jgi:hypothetical protein
MINLNSKTNQKQFIDRKIKVKSVLGIMNFVLKILQILMIALHGSIMEYTTITNIKIGRINNQIVDLMVMMTNILQQKNGKYGRLRWRNEE